MKGNLRIRERILIVLAERSCQTLDELEKRTGVTKSVLKVYLSRLAKEGIITRRWRHFKNGKQREYCLRSGIQAALGIR